MPKPTKLIGMAMPSASDSVLQLEMSYNFYGNILINWYYYLVKLLGKNY